MPKLKQVLPEQFLAGGYADTPAYSLREAEVIARKLATGAPCDSASKNDLFQPWPGPHEHVTYWFILDNGKAVGVNDDPERGCSFPVVDYQA
jgi:hypothetical protein